MASLKLKLFGRVRVNKALVWELVNAFAEFDTASAEHLGTSSIFRGMSNTIQNYIIQSITDVIQSQIDSEISSAPFIAVQVDNTTDMIRVYM